MRALVALAAVALVGLAVDAQVAAADSSPPGKRGLSISVGIGPIKADVSTGSSGASVAVSTPAASTQATVESTSETPVSAAVDTTTPVADAAVNATVAPVAAPAGDDPAAGGLQVDVQASTPIGSASVHAGASTTVDASVQATTLVAGGGIAVSAGSGRVGAATKVSTPIGRVRAVVAAPAQAGSNDVPAAPVARGAATIAPAPHTARVPGPSSVVRDASRKVHSVAPPAPQAPILRTSAPKVFSLLTERAAPSAPPVAVAPPAPLFPATGAHPFGAFPAAAGDAIASDDVDRGPVPRRAFGDPEGALGSGLSTAIFFVIVSALLMLVAPLVGRWLRPACGASLRPAFASLPERPG
ncbi:MAG TPA: hypothetical protein VFA66_09165 [Gaiellaceae bacterium]|nr:hypothetical protein [Gaiellaceae bacterium]